jgi:hypothetical protein
MSVCSSGVHVDSTIATARRGDMFHLEPERVHQTPDVALELKPKHIRSRKVFIDDVQGLKRRTALVNHIAWLTAALMRTDERVPLRDREAVETRQLVLGSRRLGSFPEVRSDPMFASIWRCVT